MPTDTFSLASAANEGCGSWANGSSTWPPDSSGFINEDNDPSNLVFVSKYASGSNRGIEMGFWRWDTSSIDDTATITAANLKVYCATVSDTADNFSLIGGYYDFGGQPTVAGDLVVTISPTILSVDLGSLTAAAVNTIALTDLTGISTTGFTGIRLGLTLGTPTAINATEIASFANANPEAKLEVTYTLPVAAVPIAWVVA